MTQRAMLILAATLSVFAMVLVGGLTSYLAAQPAAPAAAQPTAIVADPPTAQPGLDPAAVQALIDQREQSYQKLIREANDRLQQANAQLDQAYQKQKLLAAQLGKAYERPASQPVEARVDAQPKAPAQAPPPPTAAPAPTAPPPPPAPAAPAYPITPDMAVAIALNVVPGGQLTHPPELVDFQGTVAYEVMLAQGAVYVDANTGQVLYNAAAPALASGGHGGEHEGGEHEGGEHDD
jgi:uncharacterized membrane protein YkoI